MNVKESVYAAIEKEQEIFQTALRHSNAYQKAMNLSANDLQVIMRNEIKLPHGLFVKHVCIHPYGKFNASDGWRVMVMVASETKIGGGTTLISRVNEAAHERILKGLN